MLEYLQWIALLVNLPSRLHYIYLLVLWNQGMAALPYHILTPLVVPVHCTVLICCAERSHCLRCSIQHMNFRAHHGAHSTAVYC